MSQFTGSLSLGSANEGTALWTAQLSAPLLIIDWHPKRVHRERRAWEKRGEDHDLQHAPVCCPLQQDF